MSYYSSDELRDLGFASVGRNVKISRKASIYNPSRISVGDFSRIDDYCVLSAGDAGICLGRFVHIAVFGSLIGAERITLEDFAGLSSRVSIYSSNEDYSGDSLTNPTVPETFRRPRSAPVVLRRHAIIGSGSVVLPGVEIGLGACVGALSFVRKNCRQFGVYMGVPARLIGRRKQTLLELERLCLERLAP